MVESVLGPPRRFLENSWIIFCALFRWFTPQSYIVNKLAFPFLQLAVFSLLGRYAGGQQAASYLVIGNCIVLASLGSLAVAGSLSEERAQTTLPILLGTPANRLANLLQRGVVPALDSLFTVAVAVTFAALVFDVDFAGTDPVAFAASVLAAVLASMALGFLLGVVTLAWLDLYFAWNSFYLLLLIVAGINIPPDQLPGALAWLHHIVPFSHAVTAAREAVAGAGLADVAGALLAELAVAAAYLLAGYVLLRRMEAVAVRKGTLEMT